jgi:formylmethanofuran dehydrogenase subunit E
MTTSDELTQRLSTRLLSRFSDAIQLVALSNGKPGTAGFQEFRVCHQCEEPFLFTFQENYGLTTICFACENESYFSIGD